MDRRLVPDAAVEGWKGRWWPREAATIAAVVLLIVGFGVFRLHFWHLRHPVVFRGDASVVLEYVKNALQNGGTTVDPQIGWPDRASLAAFPVFDAFSAFVLKSIAPITSDPVTGSNILSYANHIVSGVIGYICFRILCVRRLAAVACAVSFAFIEFALVPGRVFGHETLQLYAPVAIGATIALLPGFRPKILDWRVTLVGVSFGAALIGLSQPYWVAFSLIVVAASAMGCIFSGRRRETAPLFAAMALMVIVTVLCLLWPRLFGAPGLNIQRFASEQPLYGLRLGDLLIPPRSHLTALNHAHDRYIQIRGDLREGTDAFVGWPGLVGLVIGLVVFLAGPFRARQNQPSITLAATLVVLLLVFCISNGIGSVFNTFVTPEIRAQNRVAPLIAFLALYIFAATAGRRWQGAVVAVAAIGLWDQTVGLNYTAFQADPALVQRWEAAKADGAAILAALPRGAKIKQLPFMPFPEANPVSELGSYDEMNVALFTKGFHYSFGSPPVAPTLAGSPVDEAVDAAAVGYDELLIYRAGYADAGAGARQALEAALGGPPNVEAPGFFGFDLRPLQAGLPPLDPAALSVRVDWAGHGFSVLERNPDLGLSFRWDDSDDARAGVTIRNGSPRPVEMRLCGTVVAPTPGVYGVTVEVPGRVIHPSDTAVGTPVDVAFAAPPGASAVTIGMPAPRLVTAAAETRRIHFQVRSPSLAPTAILDRARAIAGRIGVAMPAGCP